MLILWLTVFLPAVWLQDLQDHQDPRDLQDLDQDQDLDHLDQDLDLDLDQDLDPQTPCPSGPCNPPLGDLMLGRASRLSASSTCGLHGPEHYCILGYLQDDQKCFTCDSRLPYGRHSNPESHRIENIITTFDPDRNMRWWQSENGVHHVSIRLDLETLFQFSHMVLTFKSFRPAAMLVERSKDFGRTWNVFRFFSEDCSLHFPTASREPAGGIHSVVCDPRYSGAEPSTGGEVVLKALDPIFNIENPYDPNVQDLITLTNLRVNFTRLFTLGDTLLGDTPQGDTPQGDTPQGDTLLGDTPQGDTPQGDTLQGDTPQGDTPQGDTPQGDTLLGDTLLGDTPQGDTLLSRRRRRPEDKYYYALYNMVVRGSCFCHGHAHRCTPAGGARGDVFSPAGMVHGRCVCEHHTAGENCERCSDFHHDTPWRPGGGANTCRKCNCHGHSDSCHFDAARFEASGGVSGGVCDDCRHNRTGARCERCRDFLFLDPQRAPHHPHACIPCDCDVTGSVAGGLCDAVTGRCVCKEHVVGRRCQRCDDGFYRHGDEQRCRPCGCHSLGSVGSCDPETGSCRCDQLAAGALCDTCVAGFWGLGDSGRPCSPCDCDVGGAYSTICSPRDGRCHCLPNMEGRHCSEPAPLHFLPALHYFLFEAELAASLPGGRSPPPAPAPPPPPPPPAPTPPTPAPTLPPPAPPSSSPLVLSQCEKFYRARGYDLQFSDGRVVLVPRSRRVAESPSHRVAESPSRRVAVRRPRRPRQHDGRVDPGVPRPPWTGWGLVRVQEGAGLQFTVDHLPAAGDYRLVIRYQTLTLASDWLASVSVVQTAPGDGDCDPTGSRSLLLPGNTRAAFLDPPLCLASGRRYLLDVVFSRQDEGQSLIQVDSVGLVLVLVPGGSGSDVCSESGSFQNFHCVVEPDQTLGAVNPAVCEHLVTSMSARLHHGALRCRCDAVGSLGPSCSKVGGVCDCKPNVIGRCCDSCAPMTFGFGAEGCKPCDCDPRGSLSELCDQVRGQCACRPEVTGRRCDRCQRGLWEFPTCRPCECNGRSEECDDRSGECRECRDHTTGPRCDRCLDGYHGNPCRPCLCPGVRGSGRYFASSCVFDPQSFRATCVCSEGHAGPGCDRCGPGYYGDLALPGARCAPCPCSGNVDPADRHACDGVTGECRRCLHNTAGTRCQDCKPGYHGNALHHDCKECSCDRRGTEVTRCPLGSPCVCDPRTGQCPCRMRVTGVLCDACEDGFWNLDGGSGCQPCSCDARNSLSNVCNKVTGQCPCRPEFGGRQCDECGDNHFGDPDLQCLSCDCDLEGTERPSCDGDSGECRCRDGVTGTFCDRCAPDHDSAFPACAPCHPCSGLWTGDVMDVQRAAQTMRTLVPHRGHGTLPGYQRQRLLDLESQLKKLNELHLNAPHVLQLEERWDAFRREKDSVDLNRIRIDPSSLLVTQIDNIRLDFNKILKRLKHKVYEDQDHVDHVDHIDHVDHEDLEDLEGLLDEVRRSRDSFLEDERRLSNATASLEDSMDTRQEVKHRLDAGRRPEDTASLEDKVHQLSLVQLSRKVCGGPGLEDCSGCGGVCGLDLGDRKCRPDCDGALPVSRRTSETTERSQDHLKTLTSGLQESRNKVHDARLAAEETRVQTRDLQDQVQTNVDSLQRERDRTKDLIRRVRDFLLDETVSPEDVQKMSQAVLDIRLPVSPDHVRLLIDEIKDLVSSSEGVQVDVEDVEDQDQTVQDLVEDAVDTKTRALNLETSAVSRDVYATETSQNQANEDLDMSSRDRDTAQHHVQQMKTKLDDLETRLMSRRPEDLKDQIQSLKTKTDQNRETARDARQTAETALSQTSETKPRLDEVMRLFEDLKLEDERREGQTESRQRLKDMMDEVKDLKDQLEDKDLQIQGLELKIRRLVQNKLDKARDVSVLLETVDELRRNITRRAEGYTTCTT